MIRFREGVGFQVNDLNFINRQHALFFTDLTHVKAWFGGINENLLDKYELRLIIILTDIMR